MKMASSVVKKIKTMGLFVGILALLSCTSTPGKTESSPKDPVNTTATATPSPASNPTAATVGSAEKGEQIYRANCYACHGVDPSYNGPLGPVIQGTSRELLTIRLQKGHDNYPPGYTPKRKTAVMPALPHLLPEADNLLAYLNQEHVSFEEKLTKTTDPAMERGKQTFVSTCSGCHQPNGEGKVGLAPSLTDQDFLALVGDEFIRTTVKQGRPGTNMISFFFLQEEQITDIITYLRGFQRKPSRPYDSQWKASGEWQQGQSLYESTCAQCHGLNGKGYLLGGSGTGIGLNGFLDVAHDGYIKQILLSGREGTPMRAFGGPLGLAQLSDQEMNDIIVYLRYLGKKNAGQL